MKKKLKTHSFDLKTKQSRWCFESHVFLQKNEVQRFLQFFKIYALFIVEKNVPSCVQINFNFIFENFTRTFIFMDISLLCDKYSDF